jgi:hypothetical protein
LLARDPRHVKQKPIAAAAAIAVPGVPGDGPIAVPGVPGVPGDGPIAAASEPRAA